MKEKTFEELMHNKFDALEHYGGFKLSTKQQNAILELLQQVREATIAECAEIAWKEEDAAFIHEQIASLEADRIRIEP